MGNPDSRLRAMMAGSLGIALEYDSKDGVVRMLRELADQVEVGELLSVHVCPYCCGDIMLGYKGDQNRWKCLPGSHTGWYRQLVKREGAGETSPAIPS